MNRLIRSFLQGLHDRIIASVGSIIGSTFSTFRAAHHAEQQSFLEDLARKYESEGKTHLAEQLRSKAAALNMDDPGMEARLVFRNVLDDKSDLPALADSSATDRADSEADMPNRTPKKKRRGRKPSTPVDDMGISLD
jgi:hypothetical protein